MLLWIYQCKLWYDGSVSFVCASAEVEETKKMYRCANSMPIVYNRQVSKDDIGKVYSHYGNDYTLILTERNDDYAKSLVDVEIVRKIVDLENKAQHIRQQHNDFQCMSCQNVGCK